MQSDCNRPLIQESGPLVMDSDVMKNNVRTIIITAYLPTVSASAVGAYSQKLEALAIVKIKNDPRIQLWIDINTEVSKWIHQGEHNILMGGWNSKASEVNTWKGTQGIANLICNLQGFSDALITYQQSKYSPINGIYCSAPIAENRGEWLSFGRLVGYHRALWIDINENSLLGFRKHDIVPPMDRNLCLEDTRTVIKCNHTLRARFVKRGIYQKIHYIHNRSIYLPQHI